MKLISKNILNWLKIVINKNKNKNKNKNNLKYIKFIYYNKNNIVINMQRLFKLNSVLQKKYVYNNLVLYKLVLYKFILLIILLRFSLSISKPLICAPIGIVNEIC